MSSDLRLDTASSNSLPPVKAAAPVDASLRDSAASQGSSIASNSAVEAPADLPNPRLHTDLALNRLVLEFFNAQGTLTNSIPSQKQLDAYRLAAFSGAAQGPTETS